MTEQNPIDKDKVAENPGLLPYAHHVGSALIRPEDRGKIKSRALTAMYEQTESQYRNLQEQMTLLVRQADQLRQRVEISEQIYSSELRFEPIVGHIYHVYLGHDGKSHLSMIAPLEWGRSGSPFAEFTASVRLMADHTWEILAGEKGNSQF
jgi:hypothetical protein